MEKLSDFSFSPLILKLFSGARSHLHQTSWEECPATSYTPIPAPRRVTPSLLSWFLGTQGFLFQVSKTSSLAPLPYNTGEAGSKSSVLLPYAAGLLLGGRGTHTVLSLKGDEFSGNCGRTSRGKGCPSVVWTVTTGYEVLGR